VSTASEGALPEPVHGVRATDADRERVVARLRTAAGEGAIDLDELEQRIAVVYEVRTAAELSKVTADLPMVPPPPGAKPPKHRHPLVLEDDEFRGHLTTYCLVIGMLVVIWLLSDPGNLGHPWPIYPALGWGIGLGGHYQRASTHQRKRLARATAEGLTLDQLEQREAEEKRERKRERRARGPEAVQRRDQRREALDQAREQRRQHRDQHRSLGPGPGAGSGPTSRFVVAMFVDVAGSTQLNEALGDEQWAAVRRTFRDVVDEAVSGHGGWEANCSGDGVLARFSDPSSAADAAVTILRRLDRQRTDTGFAPSVRVGIHSGDAVEEGDDIIGNVVNLAARVTDAAGRDEILVTEHVADHLDGRHTTEGRGLHTLKGVARPRHLLCLVWR
jgi:class 3 adenylate cyclase